MEKELSAMTKQMSASTYRQLFLGVWSTKWAHLQVAQSVDEREREVEPSRYSLFHPLGQYPLESISNCNDKV